MGGSQSTRQVVVNNEKAVDVVMTEDVVRRLSMDPKAAALQHSAVYSYGHSSSVENIRQEIENEYRQRIMDKSSQNLQIKAEEFARAVEDVEAKFVKQTGTPVCQDLQEDVLKCYQNHLREPLRCSEEVRAFTQAVERERRNALMATKQA